MRIANFPEELKETFVLAALIHIYMTVHPVIKPEQKYYFFTAGVTKHWQGVPRKVVVSMRVGTQKLPRHTSGQRTLSDCLSRRLDHMTSTGPFQPQPICDLG